MKLMSKKGNNGQSNTAVLVLSCDKYIDAWSPFFALFKKYWADCLYPVYLGTNEKNFEFPSVKVINSGKAKNWSDDTLSIIEQIPEKYIIIILEDYFLINNVDTSRLEECLEFMYKTDAAYMRIASFRKDYFPMYAYDISNENPSFGITHSEAPFRVNLQAGIWEKDELAKLIVRGESPWDFEVKGSERSKQSDKLFLGITESSSKDIISGPIPYLCTAITKGIWMREAIRICKKENIALDLSLRPVESRWAYNKRKALHAVPFSLRKYVDFVSSKLRSS